MMDESKKLSITECKRILKEHGGKDYTEEQVKEIRDTLYSLAELDFQIMSKSGIEALKNPCRIHVSQSNLADKNL